MSDDPDAGAGDAPPGYQWMTYAEAGAALSVDPDSIKRRAFRNKWPRQPGNDGKARVAVPLELLPHDIMDPESWGRLAEGAAAGETARELAAVLHGLAEDARAARAEAASLAVSVTGLIAELAAKSATVAALELEIRRLVRRSPLRTTRGVLKRLEKMKTKPDASPGPVQAEEAAA